ncbi:MAG TPA: oxygenase MpaB family protein, partial [Burkholderiaceae bacterium]|nr:oxygenase MpaB family protein [Burkholderiaceae bacterium]
NPLSLFVGGVAAVVLELAEPRVRAGVWQHTSFRRAPMERLQRTAYAAMLTVYGARSRAERLIGSVVRRHGTVSGVADDGRPYAANDAELLCWVHATAAFGFLEAYCRYVRPLTDAQRDTFYAEGRAVAALYGANDAPCSHAEFDDVLSRMQPMLQGSPVIAEFLALMTHVDVLPAPLRHWQRALVCAAIALLPTGLRTQLGLDVDWRLSGWQRTLIRGAGAMADRLVLENHPAVQACRRLSLPDNYVYRKCGINDR